TIERTMRIVLSDRSIRLPLFAAIVAAGTCRTANPQSNEQPVLKGSGNTGFSIDRDLLAGVEDCTPVRNADQNYYEFRAYHYLLLQAHKTPLAWLAENARQDLTFAHLFEEPAKYRGELVHIEGKLRRLRRFDSARLAQQQGVRTIYEAWIYSDLYYA